MKKLILSLLLTVGTGALAGWITAGESSGSWFINLNKPDYQPPNWLFSPVWTTLYVLMGVALYLVWRQPASGRRNGAIGIFVVQLLLNFLWSMIFFKFQMVGVALIEIVLLWIMILVTIFSFAKISKAAAWLLVPYISWVSFATILNMDIWRLN